MLRASVDDSIAFAEDPPVTIAHKLETALGSFVSTVWDIAKGTGREELMPPSCDEPHCEVVRRRVDQWRLEIYFT